MQQITIEFKTFFLLVIITIHQNDLTIGMDDKELWKQRLVNGCVPFECE